MVHRLVQPAGVADRAPPVAPLPVPDRLRTAGQGRTVGVGSSSYLDLEGRAWELDRLPWKVLVDTAPDQLQMDRVPDRDRVDIPYRRHVVLQVDMLEGIHHQIYRPPEDMGRKEHIPLLQVRMEHSYLTCSVSSSFDHLK